MKLVPLQQSLKSRGYKFIHQSHGVTVYRGTQGSIIELAAEGVFAASPQRVWRALTDYDQHAKWLKNIAESRILSRQSNALVVYQRLDLPLLSDRDYTLAVQWGTQNSQQWITFNCTARGGPAPRPGIVRLTVHEGGWQLQPLEGGKRTLARYQLRLDLAGSLPRWLARSSAGKELPDLFETFRRQSR
jgi:hypothetical protein